MSVFNNELLSEADEEFHLGDEPYQMDSSWFGFYVPEKNIYIWAYHLVFHNQGVCSGGVFAFDDWHEFLPDMPYYGKLPLAQLSDCTSRLDYKFPTGMHLEVLEPLHKSRVRYSDSELIAFDVTFEGLVPPYACLHPETGKPFHIDHLCRVTGTLVLNGEEMAVDCLSQYDHGWGSRDTVEPTPMGDWRSWDPKKLGDKLPTYCFGAASESDNFFFLDFEFWHQEKRPIFGYFTKDGVAYKIDRVEHENDRGSDGKLRGAQFRIIAPDNTHLDVSGVAKNHVLSPNAGNLGFAELCLAEFQINGKHGWGDLQDAWPPATWRAFREAIGAV